MTFPPLIYPAPAVGTDTADAAAAKATIANFRKSFFFIFPPYIRNDKPSAAALNLYDLQHYMEYIVMRVKLVALIFKPLRVWPKGKVFFKRGFT